MGKLVRDKIPEIILNSGKKPVYYMLPDNEYPSALDIKLNEEVAEYQADKSIEELVDILEVVISICEARGYSMSELFKLREAKLAERGGFKNKFFWLGNQDE